MKTASTHHLQPARHINRVSTSEALDSFETKIKLQDAIEELYNWTNRILSKLESTRDDGSTREVYLRLAKKFYNAYEVVEAEESAGFFIPPETRHHIQPSTFDQMLENFRFQDEQKLGVYHVNEVFVPKDCFTNPVALSFGCWVAGLTINRKPSTRANEGVIEFWNSGATERHLRFDQHPSSGPKIPGRDIESMLNRFIDTPSEDSSVPFFATHKDVSLSANRRYFGLLDNSVVNPLVGNLLDNTLARIPGIHGSRLDISAGFGTPTCLHTTPAGLYSVSALLSESSRIWIVISADQRLKLQSLMREKFPDFDIESSFFGCPRHKMLFLLPSFLNSHQIKYAYFEQRVGDVVITIPGTFIQSYNTGCNVVETSFYADNYWHPPSHAMCNFSTNISTSALAQIQAGQAFESLVWPDTRLRELLAIPVSKNRTNSDSIRGHKLDSSSVASRHPVFNSEDLIDLSDHAVMDENLETSALSLVGSSKALPTDDVLSNTTSNNFTNVVFMPSPVSTLRASNAPRGPLIDFDIYEAPPYLTQVDACVSSEYLEVSLDSPNIFRESYGSDSSDVSLSFSLSTQTSSRLSSPDCNPSPDTPEETVLNPEMGADVIPPNSQVSLILRSHCEPEKIITHVVDANQKSTSSDSNPVSNGIIQAPALPPPGHISKRVNTIHVSPLLLQWYRKLNIVRSSFPSPNPELVLGDMKDPYWSNTMARMVSSIGSNCSIRLWIAHMNETFWNSAKPARFQTCLSPHEEFYLPLEECNTTPEEILRTLASLDSLVLRSHRPYSNYFLLCHRWVLQLDSMTAIKTKKNRIRTIEDIMKTHLGIHESDRNGRKWIMFYNLLSTWYACGAKVREISRRTDSIIALLISAHADIPVLNSELEGLPLERVELLAKLLQRYRGGWIKKLHQAYKLWFERIRADSRCWKPIDLSQFSTYSECDTRILELFH